MKNPIIVTGMHRSGTSLLARILESMGVFMGNRKDQHHEADHFRNLNRWIFTALGGRWDNPPQMDVVFENKVLLDKIEAVLTESLSSLDFNIKYLGLAQVLRKNSITWGWKDPRNVYTLPIWRSIFPDLKVIYIERHGVDVADSLRSRSIKKLKQLNERELGELKDNSCKVIPSIRCLRLEGAFSLWEEYLEVAEKYIKMIDTNSCLMLNYEDFLDQPEISIHKISDFLSIELDSTTKEHTINKVNSKRAFAYKEVPELLEFSKRVESRLLKKGFTN